MVSVLLFQEVGDIEIVVVVEDDRAWWYGRVLRICGGSPLGRCLNVGLRLTRGCWRLSVLNRLTSARLVCERCG